MITPGMTLTDGRCVARMRCMPTARDFCASAMSDVSTSAGAVSMRSANSSTIMTIQGRALGLSSSSPSASAESLSRVALVL